MQPCAYNLIRTEPFYRRDAFTAGLKACGYAVTLCQPSNQVRPGDVLLIWNRYYTNHELACRFERAGGIVLVAENGYLGPDGIAPVHMEPRSIYALARGYHNDSEVIPEASQQRFDALGVKVMPWRSAGKHILVCPNRSFGTPGRFMPPNWANDIKQCLEKMTKREIRVRPHPGNEIPRKPLADDLKDAWATVIWASSSGVHSLVAGIPVICEAPNWICKRAAVTLDELITRSKDAPIEMIDAPFKGESRIKALYTLAQAQFNLSEIESGEAIKAALC